MKNSPENWHKDIAEFAEKQRLEREYPHINYTALGIAVGVCLMLLAGASVIL